MSFDIRLTEVNLPDNWTTVSIKEIADINVDTIKKGNEPEFINYIDISSVGNSTYELPKLMLYKNAPSRAKRRVKENDIIISTVRPNLRQHVLLENVETNWVASTGFAVVSAKNVSSAWYLYSFLTSDLFNEHLVRVADGGAYPAFNPKEIEEAIIPWPNLESLININSVVESFYKKISLNTQINQTLESIAQAIFKSWFIDFEPVKAKIYAKQESKDPELAAMCAISGKSEAELERMAQDDFKELQAMAALFPDELAESELGDMPKGWKMLDIDKTTSLIIDHRGKTPKKLGADWSDSGITALSAKHVKDGCIVNREQLRFVDTVLYNKWMKEELEEGDILLTSEGPMGEMYYLAFDEKYCLSQRLFALRANIDLVSCEFLYFWLLSPLAKSEMNGRATGTTVVGIRQAELRKVKVLTPSKPICDLFKQKVKANLKQIVLNNNKSVNLAQIRDTLLPRLLSGELSTGQ